MISVRIPRQARDKQRGIKLKKTPAAVFLQDTLKAYDNGTLKRGDVGAGTKLFN